LKAGEKPASGCAGYDVVIGLRHCHMDCDIDIPASCFGIRTVLFRCIYESLGDFKFKARKADVDAGLKKVAVLTIHQVHLGINRKTSRELDLTLAGLDFDCRKEASRPPGGQKLLRVCARSG
jgi:hypothetical protein